LEWLIKYKKVIKARNLALKKRDKNLVIIWSEKLAVIAEKIYRTRKRVIDEINKGLKKYVYFLGAIKRHEAKVVYEGRYFEKNSFLKTLLKRINLEFEIGFTTLGPHRDDVSFLIDKRKLISFSQGEIKIFLLILKLAFLGRIKNKLKIFMVDDWISGLDKVIIKKFAFLIKKQKIPLILTAQELVKGFSGQIINFKK
jgi:DNA replication and repair protein RecF